jgi:hypothetical protein
MRPVIATRWDGTESAARAVAVLAGDRVRIKRDGGNFHGLEVLTDQGWVPCGANDVLVEVPVGRLVVVPRKDFATDYQKIIRHEESLEP